MEDSASVDSLSPYGHGTLPANVDVKVRKMQRFASMVMVYVIAVLLFAVILVICIYTMKSTNDVHPAIIFGVGGGLYTMIVLFILHSRAGTLKATPEEVRTREREEEADADVI